MKQKTLRWTVYLLGMLSLAFGIAPSGKTGLGISPISSVAFSISELSGLNYGDMTFALYALFEVAQFLLRGKNSRVIDLLQLVAIMFIGVGVSGSVKMKLIPNPGDGIVQAVAEKMGWGRALPRMYLTSAVCA